MPPEAVQWASDGMPRSTRFDDVYRSSAGGLAQARHVFLDGCGLPAAWAHAPQWRILETGFGLGLNFLAAWLAWKDDPARPALLHFISVEAWPVAAGDLLRSAQAHPELQPLAQELADQWFGLVPGVHRLAFEGARVLLTLHVGDAGEMLRREAFTADAVFLDGFDPRCNPDMWSLDLIKGVARHCRRGAGLASWTASGEVRRALAQCGFRVEKVDGLPPKRHCTRARFDPAWEPRGLRSGATRPPEDAVVIGAGLAGTAAAASLARRGWAVTVLDAAAQPAAGASALPVGLLAPHFSPDDNLLSQLSRCGVRVTMQQAAMLLQEGRDWRRSGALEHRVSKGAPEGKVDEAQAAWSRPAQPSEKQAALLADASPALWHEQAAWVRLPALVRAWLAQPGVSWRGGVAVDRIERDGKRWRVVDAQGREAASAALVVIAAAHDSARLAGHHFRLQPVRGQIAWAVQHDELRLPAFPVNGNGHFIPAVPHESGFAWFCGSTYGRGQTDTAPNDADHAANLQRLQELLPALAGPFAQAFAGGAVQQWAQVRCASADRRPLAGELEPGLWVSTAMGSRGLTFSALCAELLAAQLHDEPLPLPERLAQALHPARQAQR
ncbi:bifunctional tRNA (5-methylaminomethyl-2-thiouridine)(34)-methyltransferase MnmD/FAD-dependent 5-carboxymethylaminomethyl-2-thiouridine(34) oxidoreductase MnmC [Ramlibacter solisilvae]|uniref:tRNA 5-methylaminomethyl-2-thiouridine biosynthesis bifunctional protein MnmC n=1 Tax=Ramlibacter tataouinensis TaxID=94132 RepID=A0A127JNK7_9BURK|nr:FAD-dependent 5-carboxymethylaminomethyl-2-thiouridine(34) oxidoreductase MnmC [Ramlibacter tataouinensis]AMO21581.1 FAD-dependent cmnm(5)s(2)U34 oxidoreductase [Ramlibacter tataouinensis]